MFASNSLFGWVHVDSDEKVAVDTAQAAKQGDSTQKLQAELDHNISEINRGLQSLSFQKRLQIQEEVHGVADPCEHETPEMISQALHSMEQHLDDIWYKPLFDKIPPTSYMNTPNFRLRFLRCERYDCRKAAERLVRYVVYMNSEWGPEALERPLRLSDLERKTGKSAKGVKRALKSGLVQILPFRDRSGRLIQFAHPAACNWNNEFSVCHKIPLCLPACVLHLLSHINDV